MKAGSQSRQEDVGRGRLAEAIRDHGLELFSLVLFLFASWTLLGLVGATSSFWIGPWTKWLKSMIGWASYPSFVALAIISARTLVQRFDRPFFMRPAQVAGLEIMIFSAMPLSHLFSATTLEEAFTGKMAGAIGWALAEPLSRVLGKFAVSSLYILLFLGGSFLLSRVSLLSLARLMGSLAVRSRSAANRMTVDTTVPRAPALKPVPLPTEKKLPPLRRRAVDPIAENLKSEAKDSNAGAGDSLLPPISLLSEGIVGAVSSEEVSRRKAVIEQTLEDFNVPAKVVEVRRGPTVTQFGVEPGFIVTEEAGGTTRSQKIRVGQIAALRQDLALALKVSRLRIEAPVPGRAIVGIEVPNVDNDMVRLRDVISSEEYRSISSPLAVTLGKDVSGKTQAADLATLPHLLIAGTTGSGKSVLLNSMIASLLMNNSPDQLRLVLVDPKKVELSRLAGLPHLLGTVEVEADRIIGMLRWVISEMESRYEKFAAAEVKHLVEFNALVGQQEELGETLPYIAIFIDELADLMQSYPGEVEHALTRLAQMARATGIHLVVATQRPSTDVITGLIKANFPARISFAVTSTTDSRVILDLAGAEHLMGSGDMLYLAPDASTPVRIQGCFVSDDELTKLVAHWRQAWNKDAEDASPWEELITRTEFIDSKDEMLEEAVKLAQKYEQLSTSLLQRRLRVGYPRAARLMEALFDMGMVEDPKHGGKTRKSFVEKHVEDPLGSYLDQDPGAEASDHVDVEGEGRQEPGDKLPGN